MTKICGGLRIKKARDKGEKSKKVGRGETPAFRKKKERETVPRQGRAGDGCERRLGRVADGEARITTYPTYPETAKRCLL